MARTKDYDRCKVKRHVAVYQTNSRHLSEPDAQVRPRSFCTLAASLLLSSAAFGFNSGHDRVEYVRI